MSGVCTGRVSKQRRSRRTKTRSVLGMMAIMQDRRDSPEVPKEFLEGGRTGRRNAMPDILEPEVAEMTTADLPSRLEQLGTSDAANPQPSTSQNAAAGATERADKAKES